MKKKLLIVDDEPAIRLILRQYFSTEFEVVLKSNGLEALQWLEKGNRADAIIADYQMPLMDGPAFIQEVRSRSAHCDSVLFILSASEHSSSKIRCLKLGADDYLVKPFSLEELGLRLKNMLARLRLPA
jgi:DNA-binding response OmpR family regulator